MLRRGKRPDPPKTLAEAVKLAADCPCDLHNQEFIAAVGRTTELIFEIGTMQVVSAENPRVVGPGDRITVANVTVGGRSFLRAFSSLESARHRYPNAQFAGIPTDQALRMALGETLDGLFVGADDPTDAWAVITRGGIEDLLRASDTDWPQ